MIKLKDLTFISRYKKKFVNSSSDKTEVNYKQIEQILLDGEQSILSL